MLKALGTGASATKVRMSGPAARGIIEIREEERINSDKNTLFNKNMLTCGLE